MKEFVKMVAHIENFKFIVDNEGPCQVNVAGALL